MSMMQSGLMLVAGWGEVAAGLWMWWLAGAAVLVNVWVMLLFGWDKWRAVRGGWRVRERVLLWWMAAGPIGGLVGMRVWRHKTCKGSFRWRAGLCVVAGVMGYGGAGYVLWRLING